MNREETCHTHSVRGCCPGVADCGNLEFTEVPWFLLVAMLFDSLVY